ncbi:DUF2075 domain-containing protein [Anaerobium acetethylicum]|uniref:Uncharacterized conserved protein n=1 Tax=Anaerobium acetethylicum TaxID=1619234 RepID=A0A1D3TWK0_9FIRM|nr:DUF2075 domain-containing protein [Anaerobium acetethylicum]SCP98590.1 Uncharacterized conserved protein [Anaerobium acetethylicum]
MAKEYYRNSIKKFLCEPNDIVIGDLLINDDFETTDLQKNAWKEEVVILKEQLEVFASGDIVFEYTIPRIGSRIDTVLIINGVLFLLEFKVGAKEYSKSAKDQVMDYALDLKYFHEESKNKIIVPIIIATEADSITNSVDMMSDKIFDVISCNKGNIQALIFDILSRTEEKEIDLESWINSRYMPTPTIIEAAQALYRNHSVEDISRNDAGATNLSQTTIAIGKIIDQCKKRGEKAICFVTGVPGAGKTLAGLNIANERHQFEENEHAVFLSGNGPLVDVLHAALARDKAKRTDVTIREAERETKSFIQIIHKFRDDALSSNRAPVEKVSVFDEAQRAWDKDALTNFMNRKKGVPNFDKSEPDFLISIMDRHEDWATIICLVGGGQEIYRGEAGISDWFAALKAGYSDWKIYLSDKMTDSEYIGNESLQDLLGNREYDSISELHLGVSLRSFRSEKLSEFTKALLDNELHMAKKIYSELKETYPIVMTRNFDKAKKWVKSKARGTERYGLLASSEGKRLRANGIWVPTTINHVGWFLNGKDNVDSSFYLEVAASEFKVQGLEIDYGLLAWDADFRYYNRMFAYHKFRGDKWTHVRKEQQQKYLKNSYRVLLTRARQGLVIYVPEGSDIDPTTLREYYDGTYEYFKQIGIGEI